MGESMTKVTADDITTLLAAARAMQPGAEAALAENAFFKALLDATVYAHVPIEGAPPGRMRFIQFVHPENGQTVLPFFSDLAQAEAPQRKDASIVAMSGRRLFELTRGATLILNPNYDQVMLYPPEIAALLDGRELGNYTKHMVHEGANVAACPPSVPTAALDQSLRELFAREQTVKAAYLVEVHGMIEGTKRSLVLAIVTSKAHQERLVALATLALKTDAIALALPLDILFVGPDEPLPTICHAGIQLYGT